MKYCRQLILVFVSYSFLGGCISSKYVGRKQYLLDVPRVETKKLDQACKRTIFLAHVEAVAPFDQLNFLYRVGPNRYLIDYYNGFLVNPAWQLDTVLQSIFSSDPIKSSDVENRVQIKLKELYADYQNRLDPRGVVVLQLTLTNLSDDKNPIVLINKTFRASIPLVAKNTESLLKAWRAGLQITLRNSFRAMGDKACCYSYPCKYKNKKKS